MTDELCAKLADQANMVDAGYPENTDLVIDPLTGKPSLKRRRARAAEAAVLALEEAIKERMPERTLLEILARTAYWLEWWRRFGPASGSDPKLADPLLRYVLTTFTYGANLGPAQRPSDPRRLGARARRDRGPAFHDREAQPRQRGRRQRLPAARSVKAWGDGTSVAADGTQVNTLIDNLLAESHIRYGGYGGIAYHHDREATQPSASADGQPALPPGA